MVWLKINNQQFCTLIKTAKRLEKIKFQYWTILTDDECDFGEMKDCKIQNLNLYHCGNKLADFSNWEDKINRLSNILTGVENCENLRNSLQKMCLTYQYSFLYKDILENELKKYPKLSHIKFKI